MTLPNKRRTRNSKLGQSRKESRTDPRLFMSCRQQSEASRKDPSDKDPDAGAASAAILVNQQTAVCA